jgi:hypothetical protein
MRKVELCGWLLLIAGLFTLTMIDKDDIEALALALMSILAGATTLCCAYE